MIAMTSEYTEGIFCILKIFTLLYLGYVITMAYQKFQETTDLSRAVVILVGILCIAVWIFGSIEKRAYAENLQVQANQITTTASR
jgi:hypothetical protein